MKKKGVLLKEHDVFRKYDAQENNATQSKNGAVLRYELSMQKEELR